MIHKQNNLCYFFKPNQQITKELWCSRSFLSFCYLEFASYLLLSANHVSYSHMICQTTRYPPIYTCLNDNSTTPPSFCHVSEVLVPFSHHYPPLTWQCSQTQRDDSGQRRRGHWEKFERKLETTEMIFILPAAHSKENRPLVHTPAVGDGIQTVPSFCMALCLWLSIMNPVNHWNTVDILDTNHMNASFTLLLHLIERIGENVPNLLHLL